MIYYYLLLFLLITNRSPENFQCTHRLYRAHCAVSFIVIIIRYIIQISIVGLRLIGTRPTVKFYHVFCLNAIRYTIPEQSNDTNQKILFYIVKFEYKTYIARLNKRNVTRNYSLRFYSKNDMQVTHYTSHFSQREQTEQLVQLLQ